MAVYEADADFSEDYKAYYIDRENGLVGLHIYDYSEGINEYLLLRFDGYNLVPVAEIALTSSNCDTTRAAIVDGWLYVLTELSCLTDYCDDYQAVPVPGLAE